MIQKKKQQHQEKNICTTKRTIHQNLHLWFRWAVNSAQWVGRCWSTWRLLHWRPLRQRSPIDCRTVATRTATVAGWAYCWRVVAAFFEVHPNMCGLYIDLEKNAKHIQIKLYTHSLYDKLSRDHPGRDYRRIRIPNGTLALDSIRVPFWWNVCECVCFML